MSQHAISQILVYGNTLAASMTMLALARSLPRSTKLTWVRPKTCCPGEVLYGGLTSPEAYQFNLQLGITEPELILHTDTTFSFGTHFSQWGNNKRSWVQSFHLPFAVNAGVELHHFMTRHKLALGDFLISTQAALQGTFAHPPEGKPQSPLSRAEYGYHFDPAQWSAMFLSKLDKSRITLHEQSVSAVQIQQGDIDAVQLDDGSTLRADLYIDCSGIHRQLLAALNQKFIIQRSVHLTSQTETSATTGPACRSITGHQQGWQSVTPLRNKNQRISLLETSDKLADHAGALHCQAINLGSYQQAWQGNCVGIGHSAYALEPVTPAAYILLKKDIQRLLELIPLSANSQIERHEYNRRFQDDVEHAELFHRALYAQQREVGYASCEKLERKLSQYSHRGVLVSYDFEPFNPQDWAILHAGLNRVPQRYDRMAEQLDFNAMQNQLETVRSGIARLASSMPAHHLYLEKLSVYLRDNQQYGQQ